MKNMTLENLVRVCGGIYHGPEALLREEILSVTTDSRTAGERCLFVPIVGEKVDAHRFIPQVMEAGALAVLSERPLPDFEGPYIQIESSLLALKQMAEFYLEQLNIPVVGVSGSVGKTSTKEMIASVLKQKYCTLKTEGNFNNELGLPLTVFRLRQEHEIAVLEMGISDFGEMSRLAAIAKPHTGVITNIGTCHLEFLGDRDGVRRAKTEMFDYIRQGGHIVLNGDDDKLCDIREYHGIPALHFGMACENDYYADAVENHGLQGQTCRIHTPNGAFTAQIPVPGDYMIYNALAAAAVGQIYGLTNEQIQEGIRAFETIRGRFHMSRTPHFLVVDDCYNANPMSMKASLDIMKDSEGRNVAILGDMGELGEKEAELHREVGIHAGKSRIDVLLCSGRLGREIAEAARRTNPQLQVLFEEERDALIRRLPEYLQEGDTILVKASHFMHYEKIVEVLKEWKSQ